MLENDFKEAHEISPQEIAKKPFILKLASRLARLTSPIL